MPDRASDAHAPVQFAVVACPQCGYATLEPVPVSGNLQAHQCTACGTMLTTPVGACCIFCTYSDRPCNGATERMRIWWRGRAFGQPSEIRLRTTHDRWFVEVYVNGRFVLSEQFSTESSAHVAADGLRRSWQRPGRI